MSIKVTVCVYRRAPLCCKLFATNEKLLKINPYGAVWISEAAVPCNPVLLREVVYLALLFNIL